MNFNNGIHKLRACVAIDAVSKFRITVDGLRKEVSARTRKEKINQVLTEFVVAVGC